MPKSKNGLIGTLLVVGLVGGVLVGAYVISTPNAQRVQDSQRRGKQVPSPDVEVTRPVQQRPHTFKPAFVDGDLVLSQQPIEIPAGQDAKVFSVNEFLANAQIAPAGSRLLGVQVKDGVAYLDFNKDFDSTYGTAEEQVLVNGILAVMAQFPDVQKVQFQIEGRAMETMGNIDLSFPQPVVLLDSQNRPRIDPPEPVSNAPQDD